MHTPTNVIEVAVELDIEPEDYEISQEDRDYGKDLPIEGWTNWHTWHVALLLDNIYEYYVAYIGNMYEYGEFTDESVKAYVAGLFQRKIKGVNIDHTLESSEWYTDLSKVIWSDVADHLNSNFRDHPKGVSDG